MNAITLTRLNGLEAMTKAQRTVQLETIIGLIQTATPHDLRNFEMHLVAYKGHYKNILKEIVNLGKTRFPQNKYQQHKKGKLLKKKSQLILNPKQTDAHGNIFSFWRCLRFWESSQQGQQSPQIQNKQCQISSTIKHEKQNIVQPILQVENQHQPAKKLLQSHYRSQESTLDVLLQEQQQPLFCGPVDSVEQKDGVNSTAKQTKTWLDQKSVSPKLKDD